MNESRITAVMARIAAGTLSRAAAAEALRVDVRTINRWMRKRGVTRPRSHYSVEMEGRMQRRAWKISVANRVIAGSQSLGDAANDAGVTLRTMERWVEKAQKEAENAAKLRKRRRNARKSAGIA